MTRFLQETLVAAALLAGPLARADEAPSLVESTYMEKGAVALGLRGLPAEGGAAPLAHVEWSWAPSERLGLGLAVGAAVKPVDVQDPDFSALHKHASVIVVGLRTEYLAYRWSYLGFAPDLELGSLEAGYRGEFAAQDDRWHKGTATYAVLGLQTYLHVSPETDIGLGLGYQVTNGMRLRGLTDDVLSGPTAGLRLKRQF